MINQADTLARIYGYILSAEWGCNNLSKNQDADPAAVNDQDRQLTVMVSPPYTRAIIPDKRDVGCQRGTSNDGNRICGESGGGPPSVGDNIAHSMGGSQENGE